MTRALEHVDVEYLARATPRPLPILALPALALACAQDRPLRAVLDPRLLGAVGALLLLLAIRAPTWLLALPLLVIAWRLLAELAGIGGRLRDELALLRHGQLVDAHVLRLRPHRDALGEIDGALLACAIAVAPRRIYVGSVWLADGTEALRLSKAGRVRVICLPRTPGTWRIVEPIQSQARYDLKGPPPALPSE